MTNFCGLFYDAVSTWRYMAPNGSMIGKKRTENDLEGSGGGLIEYYGNIFLDGLRKIPPPPKKNSYRAPREGKSHISMLGYER